MLTTAAVTSDGATRKNGQLRLLQVGLEPVVALRSAALGSALICVEEVEYTLNSIPEPPAT